MWAFILCPFLFCIFFSLKFIPSCSSSSPITAILGGLNLLFYLSIFSFLLFHPKYWWWAFFFLRSSFFFVIFFQTNFTSTFIFKPNDRVQGLVFNTQVLFFVFFITFSDQISILGFFFSSSIFYCIFSFPVQMSTVGFFFLHPFFIVFFFFSSPSVDSGLVLISFFLFQPNYCDFFFLLSQLKYWY